MLQRSAVNCYITFATLPPPRATTLPSASVRHNSRAQRNFYSRPLDPANHVPPCTSKIEDPPHTPPRTHPFSIQRPCFSYVLCHPRLRTPASLSPVLLSLHFFVSCKPSVFRTYAVCVFFLQPGQSIAGASLRTSSFKPASFTPALFRTCTRRRAWFSGGRDSPGRFRFSRAGGGRTRQCCAASQSGPRPTPHRATGRA